MWTSADARAHLGLVPLSEEAAFQALALAAPTVYITVTVNEPRTYRLLDLRQVVSADACFGYFLEHMCFNAVADRPEVDGVLMPLTSETSAFASMHFVDPASPGWFLRANNGWLHVPPEEPVFHRHRLFTETLGRFADPGCFAVVLCNRVLPREFTTGRVRYDMFSEAEPA